MSVPVKKEENLSNEIDQKKELLKRTICKGITDDELELFSEVCKRTGLNPFMKQIYPIKRTDNKEKKEVMTIQTSIDGFRLIAERTGKYAPGKEAHYSYNENKELISATAYVKKQTTDGTWHEVAVTAFYDEYVQCFKNKETGQSFPSQFWNRMPHVMLAKCAESLALRKAFPFELCGIYSQEEMSQSISVEPSASSCIETEEFISEKEKKVLEELLEEDPEASDKICKTLSISSPFYMQSKHFEGILMTLLKRKEVRNARNNVA